MIEEVHAVAEQKEKLLEEEKKRKAEEAEEAKKTAERKKARAAGKKPASVAKRLSGTASGGGGGGAPDQGRKTSQETRGRSNSRGREASNVTKSPARPGVARRAASKSPAARN